MLFFFIRLTVRRRSVHPHGATPADSHCRRVSAGPIGYASTSASSSSSEPSLPPLLQYLPPAVHFQSTGRSIQTQEVSLPRLVALLARADRLPNADNCQAAISRPIVWVSFASNVSTDLYLISIPLPMLWRSSLKMPKKIASTIVLGSGVFVLVCATLKSVFVLVVSFHDPKVRA